MSNARHDGDQSVCGLSLLTQGAVRVLVGCHAARGGAVAAACVFGSSGDAAVGVIVSEVPLFCGEDELVAAPAFDKAGSDLGCPLGSGGLVV